MKKGRFVMNPGQVVEPNQGDKPENLQPGEAVQLAGGTSGSNNAGTAEATQTTAEPPADTALPSPPESEPEPVAAASEPVAPQTAQEPSDLAASTPEPANWNYEPDNGPAPQLGLENSVSWTASEYIDHEKRAGWYLSLAGLAAGAAAIMYLITRDAVSIVVAVIVAGLFGVTGARKPRTLNYTLDPSGITIGPKHYPYDDFKSFALLDEGAFSSVLLLPLKRFMPPLSIYYPPEQEDSVLRTIASYLPHEDRTHDPIERLMRRLRF